MPYEHVAITLGHDSGAGMVAIRAIVPRGVSGGRGGNPQKQYPGFVTRHKDGERIPGNTNPSYRAATLGSASLSSLLIA